MGISEVPKQMTYCSYADKAGCRGVVILNGKYDAVSAAIRAHQLKISPGGQLLAINITREDIPPQLLTNVLTHLDQLVSAEDARRLFDGEELGGQCL